MHTRMLRRPTALLAVLLGALVVTASDGARAADAGALKPLPADMRAAADTYLPGIIGDPVPAFVIDPGLASLAEGTRSYRIVSGDDKGKVEAHRITPVPEKPNQWRYQVGARTAVIEQGQGQLSIVSEEDEDQGVLTRYTPPLPLLVTGMNAGDEKSWTITVDVYDLDKPSKLKYEGTLDLKVTYVGAYKASVPAGTFDAAALRWHFKGKIGPATVEDTVARLVADKVGMVAAAEKKDIAAFLIYNDQSKIGKALEKR